MQQQQQVSQQQGGTATSAQESSGPTQQTAGGQQVVAASSQGQQQQVSMELQQTVASSAQQVQQQALLVNTANIQQQMQVPQQVGMSTPQSPMCSANNTISTMQAQGSITQPVPANTPAPQLQQVSDWNTGRVQVLQQPVQNAYVQQLYNAQGQMLMSSNIALHPGPANINPAGSIQVITAGKPFQSNQINAHVLGKPVIAGTQQTSFPSYATIPTTTNQTLVIGSLISSQPNILPAHSGSTQQQKQEIQKTQQVKSGQNSSNSVQSSLALSGCVVSQSPTMLHHLISPIQVTFKNGRRNKIARDVDVLTNRPPVFGSRIEN
uniref:Uncharacterized protein n=1 Tax=Rhodnius prolixus TaxID=13249 RepID=T1HKS8_RHOPR